MTNLAHWQDDIEDALGGDFDGSLSGLCIMSLSFDFTRNGAGSHSGVNHRENNSLATTTNTSATAGQQQSTSGPYAASSCHHTNSNKQLAIANIANNDSHNENSINCFKRFKSASLDHNQLDGENRSSNNTNNTSNSKIARQLQQIKNCLNNASLAASQSNNNNNLSSHYHDNDGHESQDHHAGLLSSTSRNNNNNNHHHQQQQPDPNRSSSSSPASSIGSSCNRASALSTTSDESSRSSTIDARSPSPSQSSSISSTHSRVSSRSQSPSDMSVHGGVGGGGSTSNKDHNASTNLNQQSSSRKNSNSNNFADSNKRESHRTNQDGQHVSLYSVKDNLFNGGTLKESSYTTSVITTTAPMHFKTMHHQPFSLKQFPPSPYHQFSNSSLNHDFYDRYMSHDSHQPLQTPLIGIERTQDILSLKLPPHGPDEADSQRFSKDWPFEEIKQDQATSGGDKKDQNQAVKEEECGQNHSSKCKESASGSRDEVDSRNSEKGFPFNYKSSSSVESIDRPMDPLDEQPIDLNVSYGHQNHKDDDDHCCHHDEDEKDSMFNESMRHFNPDTREHHHHQVGAASSSYRSSSKQHDHEAEDNNHQTENARDHHDHEDDDDDTDSTSAALAQQYHGQESMFGIDPSKQKFHYALAAPISVATKLTEDTMTYLNQGQAYEIKLENTTDVAEAKKGFMCSIINIGFHERHMQQNENELWQQWSHQHPNEKIFVVDMKLSYNVFGVESDGLNKYEFLWDSSKVAGVFIRINSISTEFTAKKHGGEKGVPFKLSIETFSYNSKTHDSYFISAACCQIKVFKPKGAERKIRSDRDKICKRPPSEQEKYHRSCDHTIFRECSLSSLHPMADGSLCYYRHSHGHFASKQVVSAAAGGSSSAQSGSHQPQDLDSSNANNQQHNHSAMSSQDNQSTGDQSSEQNRSSQINNDSETSSTAQPNSNSNQPQQQQQRDFHANIGRSRHSSLLGSRQNSTDYSTNRLIQGNHYAAKAGSFESSDQTHDQNQFGAATSAVAAAATVATASHQQHQHQYQSHLNSCSHSNPESNYSQPQGEQLAHHQPASFHYHHPHHSGPSIRSSMSGLSGIGGGAQHFGTLPYYGHHHPLPSTIPSHIPATPTGYAGTMTNQSAMSAHHHHHHQAHGSHAAFSMPTQSPHPAGIKCGVSSIYRPFGCQHDKPSTMGNTTLPTGNHSFKASSLAISSTPSNSFQSYLGATSHNSDLCSDNQSDDIKDASLALNGGYQHHDGYDPHPHHSFHSNSTVHHNQGPSKPRSASALLTNTQGHCAGGYPATNGGNHNQGRLFEGYSGNNSSLSDTHAMPNPWCNTNGGPSQTSSNYNPPRNTSSNMASAHSEGALYSSSTASYGLSNNGHNFDSDQNSPQRISHSNDSSSSCCSRLKNNSSTNPYTVGPQQENNNHQSPPASFASQVSPNITVNSDCQEVAAWFNANRFAVYAKTFKNFSGSDLLRLSRSDLIEICGLIDGIRLYNNLHNQPIGPKGLNGPIVLSVGADQ